MSIPHPVLNPELHWHNKEQWNTALEMLRKIFKQESNDLLSGFSNLSFPQQRHLKRAQRDGNPSERQERFRTSRNDSISDRHICCNIELSEIRRIAVELRAKIDAVDVFIQENTAKVCPDCKKVCCINKHGYYDYQDLIYIYALALQPPAYKEGIADTEPCQFLGQYGCTIERSIRPFRCNWHFCSDLINFMSAGQAKPLRAFNLQFRELQGLKQEMIDLFFEAVRHLDRSVIVA